jgi:DNA invertase Pin-like site-specific DNA recombinase
MTKYIAYIRTSTEGQQNGLEAQQTAIEAFLSSYGGEVLETYTEQVSGAKDNRTELQNAIKACKKHNATLLVSKLDRLSRKVSFIANLMETKIDLTVCAMPSASTFQLHLFACLAEEERRWISERTKAALAVKKAQGVKLGSPLNAVRAKEAKQFAVKMKPLFDELKEQGIKSLNAIARSLNDRGVETFAGGKWYPSTVKNTLGYLV